MAATVLYMQGTILVEGIDADWDYDTDKPHGWPDNPRLSSIEFHPGSTSDRMVVKQHGESGIDRFDSGEADSVSDNRIKYFHGTRCSPFIDYSECTLSAGHKVIIELWREA
jgi:hypothetical protein